MKRCLPRILEAVQEAMASAERFSEAIEAGVRAVFEESRNYQDVLEIINARMGFFKCTQ